MENLTTEGVIGFQELTLSTIDYAMFGSLILLSLVIGLYFGFFSDQNSTKEYLFGGKNMGYVPVATSMLAGHVSGITLLGVPTEVYQHGSTYFLITLTVVITCLVISWLFLPVFYKLQLPSTYEYLEMRFSKRVRSLASLLYIISLVIYIPIVIYVPVLAFSQLTGYSLYLVTPVLCSICIIYTSLGGVKAVIWTDTIQFVFTMGGLLAVFFIGLNAVGGLSTAWNIASTGNRTQIFDMNPSLYVRKSFWGMTISYTAIFLTHLGVSQNCVQRFLSIPSERSARKALLLLAIGMIVMKIVCGLTGIAMYAWYRGCDPLRAKIVERSDQILPYYVMDTVGHLSGLPGIFLAGLVSCALSTMSAALNTLAGTIYDDFIEPWLPESANKELRATSIMKVTAVLVGLLGMTGTFLVQHLGTIFEVSVSIRSVVEGPLLGLFITGMLLPWVGRRGALWGSLVSIIAMLVLVIGNRWASYRGQLRQHHAPLPTSIDGCPSTILAHLVNNVSTTTTTTMATIIGGSIQSPELDEPFFLFRVSMLHFSMMGTLVMIITALVTSLVTGESRLMVNSAKDVNTDLYSPLVHRFLPKKKYKVVPIKDFLHVDSKLITADEKSCQELLSKK